MKHILGDICQRNMLLLTYLMSSFLVLSAATDPKTCLKKCECAVAECFQIMGPATPVCNSTKPTEHCSINGSYITQPCDEQLYCKGIGQQPCHCTEMFLQKIKTMNQLK
ncbi:hypothetical protein COCON_G00002200 [Conger conger]|uniref:Uncharacterized protein n=1 Tax=Conger conger TaxID=82655 RepID=A0A9Q1E0T9_CONCO|nr:hypothetical protein COCON_G00002200 [Conger conger]